MEPEETEVDDTIPVMLGGALPSAEALKVYQRRSSLVENQIRSHMAALEKARDNLRAQRAGPSSAERLLSIAAALGQPTRTGSFGETLGNVGVVLSSQEKAKREAAAENAALAEKYGIQIGNEQLRLLMQGETGAREALRAATATEAAAARAAAAAAGKTAPTFAYDQFGKLREIPAKGTVLYPRTKEEYDAVPIGAFYEVPSGPAQGTIVKKRG